MKKWLQKLFPPRISRENVESAIALAESRTTAEIRVAIVHTPVDDPVDEAMREFQKLGMDQTAQRNGVLILLAPDSRKFAVIGDLNVNKVSGGEFWHQIVAEMKAHFKRREFTHGLVHGIGRIGDFLAIHFPRQGPGTDELPNQVVDIR